MIQQETNQIITHQPKGSVEISFYLEWANRYGFMISCNKHWLPNGREKGLGDPSSPFSCSTNLATGRDSGDPSVVRQETKSFSLHVLHGLFYLFDEKEAVCQSEESEATKM